VGALSSLILDLLVTFTCPFLAAARLSSVFVFTPRELGVGLVFFLQTTHQGLIFAIDFCFPPLRIFCSVVLLLALPAGRFFPVLENFFHGSSVLIIAPLLFGFWQSLIFCPWSVCLVLVD
jgi:hypothetical protein